MKKINILKIIKIVIAVLTASKTIRDEVKASKTALKPESEGNVPIDNTDPQNPVYPPKK